MKPIIGADLPTSDYFKKVVPFYNSTGKLLTPAELGCALSHISIYKKVIDNNCGAIIFESDIVPTKKQLESASALCMNTTADFIHLGWHPDVDHGRYFKGSKSINAEMYKVDTSQGFYGAFAYFISEKMASELLDYHKISIKLADSWARFFLTSDIVPYFYPIFMHPPTRNEMHEERLALSQNVHSLSAKNIKVMVKKLLIQKLAILKFWNKSIVPPNK
ncbi:glycosyltransferase family 25 protein [Glaciecola sp. SC05]|uniref:glycosyltransferase family 25 protein n=1 Tax=Glaciecola sp. SC05 TaxID=1987355 RepID=UPI003527A152